jgi:hypothetical protein
MMETSIQESGMTGTTEVLRKPNTWLNLVMKLDIIKPPKMVIAQQKMM